MKFARGESLDVRMSALQRKTDAFGAPINIRSCAPTSPANRGANART
jgi:hypothetical protein